MPLSATVPPSGPQSADPAANESAPRAEPNGSDGLSLGMESKMGDKTFSAAPEG